MSAIYPPKTVVRALFTANGISMTGNQLAFLAIPWFVLATTGSAAQTGITAFFSLLPVIIATFFGGTFIDRIGFKRSSIIADIASGLSVLFIPLLFSAGLLPFWMLQVLVFLGALLDAPGVTARDAMLPELATAAGMPLERIASINQIVERGSRLLGAPIAGFLIAYLSAENVLFLNTATFIISALLVWWFVPDVKIEKPAETAENSYFEDLKEGIAYLRQDTLMFTVMAIILVTNFLDGALGSVIYPVFVKEVYGSAVGLGLLFGISGAGAVLGALAYSRYGHQLSKRKVYAWGFIFVACGRVILTFLPPLSVLLASAFMVGLASGPLNPVMSTAGYERIPQVMRGRVLGLLRSVAFMAMPLGVLLAGYALEWIGLRPTLIIVAAVYSITALSLLANRVLYQLDEPPLTH